MGGGRVRVHVLAEDGLVKSGLILRIRDITGAVLPYEQTQMALLGGRFRAVYGQILQAVQTL